MPSSRVAILTHIKMFIRISAIFQIILMNMGGTFPNRALGNSQLISFYNDGLVVFLYDDANLDRIRRANPSLLESFSDQDCHDPVFAELARTGSLVAYELSQDDTVAVEVCIRQPLEENELSHGPWKQAQQARLNLPSGALCIEGYNTLRCLPDYKPGQDQDSGAVIRVPNGNYLLSLYRVDWDRLETQGTAHNWKGPNQRIILTPVRNTDVADVSTSVLRVAQKPVTQPNWVRAYQIQDGVFYGLIQIWPNADAFEINLDPAAAKHMKLEAGMILSVKVASLDLDLRGLFLGESVGLARQARASIAQDPAPPPWEVQWLRAEPANEDRLFFEPTNSTGSLDVPSKDRELWIPAEITTR